MVRTLFRPVTATAEWIAAVVLAINTIGQGYPFVTVDTLPPIGDVQDGCTFFSKATGKVHTASGGAWQAHW
jgi:hypothetical protein